MRIANTRVRRIAEWGDRKTFKNVRRSLAGAVGEWIGVGAERLLEPGFQQFPAVDYETFEALELPNGTVVRNQMALQVFRKDRPLAVSAASLKWRLVVACDHAGFPLKAR